MMIKADVEFMSCVVSIVVLIIVPPGLSLMVISCGKFWNDIYPECVGIVFGLASNTVSKGA
jgi:hypothetical protein